MGAHPVTLFQDSRRLVRAELESSLLAGSHVYLKSNTWSAPVLRSGLFVDLSKVEWVELGAVVQLITLIEAAIRDAIKISIALPLRRIRKSELRFIQRHPEFRPHVQGRVRARVAAASYLNHLRFTQAAKCQHLTCLPEALRIISDYDASTFDISEEINVATGHSSTEQDEGLSRLYNVTIPLTWIPCNDQSESDRILNLVAHVITGESRRTGAKRGLSAADGDMLANVILYELVDNVGKHAGVEGWALLAGWARPSTAPIFPYDYLESTRPYLTWLGEQQSSAIEIVLGDSGRGVVQSLTEQFDKLHSQTKGKDKFNPADIMLWAFDRWSSSQGLRSGTRGLYRVDRIVKKYCGLITLRSENKMVGLDHGGPSYDAAFIDEKKLSNIPGTLLQLWLPPFTEKIGILRTNHAEVENFSLEIVVLGRIGLEPIDLVANDQLQGLLSRPASTEPSCVMLIVEYSNSAHRENFERLLKQAAQLRHPRALVILTLESEWDEISNSIESVNLSHQLEKRGAEQHGKEHDPWDPVLIVGRTWNSGWAGVSESIGRVLNTLMVQDGKLEPAELNSIVHSDADRGELLRILRNESHLVRIGGDGSIIFRLGAVRQLFAKCISLKMSEGANIQIAQRAILHSAYRTPTLNIIRVWIDLNKLFQAAFARSCSLFALATKVQLRIGFSAVEAIEILLSDSASSAHNAALLKEYLRIPEHESASNDADWSNPGDIHMLESEQQVLVYVDILSSGEGARRCLRQILQCEARPIVVACLIDARSDKTSLKEWGFTIPVVALCEIAAASRTHHEIRDLNSVTRTIETASASTVDNLLIDDQELRVLLERRNALYFSHIGRPTGRHFTFFIDGEALVDEPSIGQHFLDLIHRWLRSSGQDTEQSFELWYPHAGDLNPGPAARIAHSIKALRAGALTLRPLQRQAGQGHWHYNLDEKTIAEGNVVFVDWGSLTGQSIFHILQGAGRAGAKRVLACVLISQLPLEEESNLRSLKQIEIFQTERTEPGVLDLRFDEQNAKPPSKSKVSVLIDVSVQFLARFPTKTFSSADCPVCKELTYHAREDLPTQFLHDFNRIDRRRRLRLRSREELRELAHTDLADASAGRSLANMARFKGLLELATFSTAKRALVSSLVEDWIQCDKRVKSSSYLDCYHFLSIERQWLDMPPLCFNSVRSKLALIAREIATDAGHTETDRVNAVSVLAVASPEEFTSAFYDILLNSLDYPSLIALLFYEAYRLLTGPLRHAQSLLQELEKRLLQVQTKFEELRPAARMPSSDTLYHLVNRCSRELSRVEAREYSPAEAWRLLQSRQFFGFETHDPIPMHVLRMQPGDYSIEIEEMFGRPGVNNIDDLSDLLKFWLQGLYTDWRECCMFFDNKVLPLIYHIREILDSKDARLTLGEDAASLIIDYSEQCFKGHAPLTDCSFSKLVRRISDNPREILIKDNWDHFFREVKWWRGRVFSSLFDEINSSRMAALLAQVPVDIQTTFRKVHQTLVSKDSYPDTILIDYLQGFEMSLTYKVFCFESLYMDCVRELLINAHKHRVSDEIPVTIWVDLVDSGSSVTIIVENSGSEEHIPTTNHGRGLTSLRERLSAFGGSLKREIRTSDSSVSHCVAITLCKFN